MTKQKPLTHMETIKVLDDCASTVSILSYQEAIEGYFKLRGLEIPPDEITTKGQPE
jgi:hypothetical protein